MTIKQVAGVPYSKIKKMHYSLKGFMALALLLAFCAIATWTSDLRVMTFQMMMVALVVELTLFFAGALLGASAVGEWLRTGFRKETPDHAPALEVSALKSH